MKKEGSYEAPNWQLESPRSKCFKIEREKKTPGAVSVVLVEAVIIFGFFMVPKWFLWFLRWCFFPYTRARISPNYLHLRFKKTTTLLAIFFYIALSAVLGLSILKTC